MPGEGTLSVIDQGPALETVTAMRRALQRVRGALEAYARAHGGRYILFGSAVHGFHGAHSDVDLVADFPPEEEAAAVRFAEHLCGDHGLSPDVHEARFLKPAVLARALETGACLDGTRKPGSGRSVRMAEAWADIEELQNSAIEHFRNAVEDYAEGEAAHSMRRRRQLSASVQHEMVAGHTSVEALLRRLLDGVGEPNPQGSDWHAALLRQVCAPTDRRPAILPPDLCADLDITRRFRHRALHGYDHFDLEAAQPAVAAAARVAEALPTAFDAFRSRMGV